jgi:GT2 family glycosyltransferase
LSDYRLYIPHVNREDLLDKAVNSVWDLRENLTIIDNSQGGLVRSFPGFEIVRPTVPLLFFQTMNFILTDALRRGCKIAMFMHSDGEVTKPGFASEVLQIAREAPAGWGVIFTLYDVLAAYNTEVVETVGLWDSSLPWYWADDDYFRRLRLSGMSVIEAGGEHVKHVGSATINSDERMMVINHATFPLYEAYYERRWGGKKGTERYAHPFNRPDWK